MLFLDTCRQFRVFLRYQPEKTFPSGPSPKLRSRFKDSSRDIPVHAAFHGCVFSLVGSIFLIGSNTNSRIN